jgi:hypothetical protein
VPVPADCIFLYLTDADSVSKIVTTIIYSNFAFRQETCQSELRE